MKRLLLAVGLLSMASISHASVWVPVSTTQGIQYFADPGSVKAQADNSVIFDVSVLADFQKPRTASYNSGFLYHSTISVYRVDCAGGFISVLGVAYYPAGKAGGKALRRYTFDAPAHMDIVRWSLFDDIRQYVCKDVPSGPELPALEDMKPTIIHDDRKSAYSKP